MSWISPNLTEPSLDLRQLVLQRVAAVRHGRQAALQGPPRPSLLLQGGHHPNLRIEWYEDLFADIKARYPIHLHALSPSEILHIAHFSRISLDETLRRLRDAGHDSLPGGGAEILVDRVRDLIAPKKTKSAEWLGVMRDAHRLGVSSTATMMYGHVETLEERVEHMRRVRELQDETRGFRAFISWTFQHEHTDMPDVPETFAEEYLRTLAVSRLFLDNIVHFQTSWVTQGKKIGQVALSFGADDMGSIMIEENVVSAAGTRYKMSQEEMERLIASAGYTPRQRTNLYERIVEPGETAELARRYRHALTAENRALASPLPVLG